MDSKASLARTACGSPRSSWPGGWRDGGFAISSLLVVLADDARHRASRSGCPARTGTRCGSWPAEPDDGRPLAGLAEALAARLLAAATVTVTGVHLDDLDPEATAVPERPGTGRASVGLSHAGAARRCRAVAVPAGYGLALAVAAGAPVLVADAVLDRLAVAGTGDDLPSSLLARARRPVAARPGARPRFEPRNLTFDDGLDRWDFGGSFRRAGEAHDQDYSCSAADHRAVISAAAVEPHGFAALHQVIAADDFRGRRSSSQARSAPRTCPARRGCTCLSGRRQGRWGPRCLPRPGV